MGFTHNCSPGSCQRFLPALELSFPGCHPCCTACLGPWVTQQRHRMSSVEGYLWLQRRTPLGHCQPGWWCHTVTAATTWAQNWWMRAAQGLRVCMRLGCAALRMCAKRSLKWDPNAQAGTLPNINFSCRKHSHILGLRFHYTENPRTKDRLCIL